MNVVGVWALHNLSTTDILRLGLEKDASLLIEKNSWKLMQRVIPHAVLPISCLLSTQPIELIEKFTR